MDLLYMQAKNQDKTFILKIKRGNKINADKAKTTNL